MYNTNLDTFMTVAECGSFSKAASRLFVTPSAVIQQINALEARLKVPLFIRTNKGVSLTKQGIYLQRECGQYIMKGKQIQSALLSMQNHDSTLVLGTSMQEKCRVFYDLWVEFSALHPSFTVELRTIDTELPIPQEIDIIESVKTQAAWQTSWRFFELCHIPYGIAVAKDHPLYQKKTLNYEDLRNYTLILLRDAQSAALYDHLKGQGFTVTEMSGFGSNVVWNASIHKWLVILPMCVDDAIHDMYLKPVEWEYSVPYGFYFREDHSELIEQFLSFTDDYYPKHRELQIRLTTPFKVLRWGLNG